MPGSGGSVPVQEVLYAEPNGREGIPPFALLRYVEGISLQELKRGGDMISIAQAAHSAGETLALIARMQFSAPGWVGPGLRVKPPSVEYLDSAPHVVEQYLVSKSLESRMPGELRDQTRDVVNSVAPQLAALSGQASLVHGDFGKRNLILRRGSNGWIVAAVLDWEFAFSGPPLIDLAHLLRYEIESRPILQPHFSNGYLEGGGTLPDDWRRLGRVVDLISLCESLTHDDLSDTVTAELIELVRSTVANCDARLSWI